MTTRDRIKTAGARFVSRRSDEQLGRLERGPQRRMALEALFATMKRRFDPVVAGDFDGVVEFRILDDVRRPAERYQLTIRDGQCTVERNGAAKPDVFFATRLSDLLRVGSGAVGWPELLGSRRIELGGDPFMGLRVLSIFAISPRAETA
jgi:predicted lipid carrier protein YhbT